MKRFIIPLAVLAAAGLLLALFIAGNNSSTNPQPSASPTATVRANPAGLPGLLTGPAPWPSNTDQLAARLSAIGLPKLTAEGSAMHIHQHLDIIVNGQPVAVPAEIGISAAQDFISIIHTHDTTGIIHVESPTVQTFYLGQFFDIWGVQFTKDCLGGYCNGHGNELTLYLNGAKYTNDPRQIKLASHQQITVVYGPTTSTPNPLPSSYPFPSGY